ncbi:MAG: ABC transporter [Planctomycetes bacterium RBG_16_59_8]|nr:MAG: ABC transporter [Planctomycetes bacterium RBG_16_59_8]
MIDVKNLTKIFPGTVAVDDVSFGVERGEVLGFLGPNGAGKTTTMRILTGFIPPTAGSVSVNNMDVVRQSMEVRRLVGYLPESNPLYTEMRVGEYLTYRAKLKRVPAGARSQRVSDAVSRCGLADVKRRVIGQLSKGFRQRVGLADAIVHDPEIIVLDEPTIGLDPNQVRQVRELIRELGEKRTVILSTHILPEVELICRRVVIISRGKIAAVGTPEEIAGRLHITNKVRAEIGGDSAAIRRELEKVEGVTAVSATERNGGGLFQIESATGVDVRERIYQACVRNGWPLRELAFERRSLEDAFVELTHGEKETK